MPGTVIIKRGTYRPPTPCNRDYATIAAAKSEGARQLASQRANLSARIAAAIESHPAAAFAVAKDNLDYWRAKRGGLDHFRSGWQRILTEWTPEQVCTLLRDQTESTEQWRISNPFAGVLR